MRNNASPPIAFDKEKDIAVYLGRNIVKSVRFCAQKTEHFYYLCS